MTTEPMLSRLDDLEEDLLARRQRAVAENWLGEIEGLDLTLTSCAASEHKHVAPHSWAHRHKSTSASPQSAQSSGPALTGL